jgi:ABC-2 type transport system ATP-binding protein
LTVLVSTHYMDEAERCHGLAYICYGRLLAQGTSFDLIAHAALASCEVTGPAQELADLARRLRIDPHLRSVASFGTALHVSASSEAALNAALESVLEPGQSALQLRPAASSLEDVFIALMQDADDNMDNAAQQVSR